MTRNKTKTTKMGFCQSLEWDIDIRWSGLVGLHAIDIVRLAKIELVTRGYADHYRGFLVTVLNKHEGVVDKTYFPFTDHLDECGPADHKGFEVISYVAWRWYRSVPETTRPFCAAIESHLDFFR